MAQAVLHHIFIIEDYYKKLICEYTAILKNALSTYAFAISAFWRSFIFRQFRNPYMSLTRNAAKQTTTEI